MRDQYVSEVEVECGPGHMDTHPFQRKVLFGVCVGRAREREKMRGEAKGGEESSKGREMGSEYFQLICLFRARVKSAA